jgi:large subunit ribosomal protein L4e
MSTCRPVVSVYSAETGDKSGSVKTPAVFSAPLRPDIVRFIHTNMAKNKRQAQGVKFEAGYDTAAISWGTGRAVARIPRVPGGGTHRSGQGAFGNMCRGGGMFAPLKTWRKWHHKCNTTQKRHAVASAVAATALPALVMARGHKIDEVPELPLVVSDDVQKFAKTKQALKLLTSLGAQAELDHVTDSKKLRRGIGKIRNRRYTMRKGPLVVYAEDEGITKSFRNIPGVQLCNVERMNLLTLAPGGTFGRFVVYTEGAMKKMNHIFGTYKGPGTQKKGYRLQRPLLDNPDIARLINSDEVQAVVRPALTGPKKYSVKKTGLKNKGVAARLRPGINKVRKHEQLKQTKGTKQHAQVQEAKKKRRADCKKRKSQSKDFYNKMMEAYKPKVEEADEEDDE